MDGVAAGVEALRQRLKTGAPIRSRELRAIWGSRLRPFWRLHIDMYRALSKRFLELGENYLASEVADEGGQFFGDDVALILTRALATARSGAPRTAQDFLRTKQAILEEAEEAKSLLARTFKDLWKSSGETRYLEESFALYHRDYETTKGDRTFPGVNAASMAFFLGRQEEAGKIAAHVLSILAERPDTSGYWDQATIAECLLVEGRVEDARKAYATATAAGGVATAHLATTRAQARLLLRHLGRDEREFDPCFPLPGVLVFTGHRIDDASRAVARFPADLEDAVKDRIRAAIRDSGAGFGYAAAANGADILFLECMQEAGLETFVHLPLPEADFVKASVESPDHPGWVERFRRVLEKATDYTAAPQAAGTPVDFDYGNRLILGAASQKAAELGSSLRFLAVWNGERGGRGGTGDFVRIARESGCDVDVIELPGKPSTPGVAPAPDSDEQILSILAVSLRAGDEPEATLAACLEGAVAIHREIAGSQVRVFFADPADAADTALRVQTKLAGHLDSALGLHAGPVRSGRHPVTGTTVMRGFHADEAALFSQLQPSGLIYASSAFAALLGGPRSVKAEFLGSRPVRPNGTRVPVFQVSRPAV